LHAFFFRLRVSIEAETGLRTVSSFSVSRRFVCFYFHEPAVLRCHSVFVFFLNVCFSQLTRVGHVPITVRGKVMFRIYFVCFFCHHFRCACSSFSVYGSMLASTANSSQLRCYELCICSSFATSKNHKRSRRQKCVSDCTIDGQTLLA
jgi:hypothetical protein